MVEWLGRTELEGPASIVPWTGLPAPLHVHSVLDAQIMASTVLGGVPLLIVFMFFQKQIVQGIAGTGLKG